MLINSNMSLANGNVSDGLIFVVLKFIVNIKQITRNSL